MEIEIETVTDFTEAMAVRSLAALAQPQRLRAFRALVVAGERGLTPGALAALLNVAPSSLSFHLKELSYSGLTHREARGRNLVYRANFSQMNAMLAYLTQHCCQGQACDSISNSMGD
jgi:ArsR family transcriptional regulator, arsenate/arsenite/antimonite-responsive transcriptional repressor